MNKLLLVFIILLSPLSSFSEQITHNIYYKPTGMTSYANTVGKCNTARDQVLFEYFKQKNQMSNLDYTMGYPSRCKQVFTPKYLSFEYRFYTRSVFDSTLQKHLVYQKPMIFGRTISTKDEAYQICKNVNAPDSYLFYLYYEYNFVLGLLDNFESHEIECDFIEKTNTGYKFMFNLYGVGLKN